MGMGLVDSRGDGFARTWGAVYQRFFLGLKQSESISLEIPVLTPVKLPPESARGDQNINESVGRSSLIKNFEKSHFRILDR